MNNLQQQKEKIKEIVYSTHPRSTYAFSSVEFYDKIDYYQSTPYVPV